MSVNKSMSQYFAVRSSTISHNDLEDSLDGSTAVRSSTVINVVVPTVTIIFVLAVAIPLIVVRKVYKMGRNR